MFGVFVHGLLKIRATGVALDRRYGDPIFGMATAVLSAAVHRCQVTSQYQTDDRSAMCGLCGGVWQSNPEPPSLTCVIVPKFRALRQTVRA